MALKETSLGVIDKMSRAELKRAIMMCFDYAPDATPIDRLAVLQEAEFYTRELERRADSRTSIRDLILEIIVIGMIGWEIWVGYRADDVQRQNFREEKAVLENLRDSSGATAQTLVAVKDSMNAMKVSLQEQVKLYYDVQLNVVYDEQLKKLRLINDGRSNLTIFAGRVSNTAERAKFYDKPIAVTPTGSYDISMEDSLKTIAGVLPKGTTQNFSFTFLVRNQRKEPFTVTGDLVARWKSDAVTLDVPNNAIVPGWKEK